jgi:hypothetical protein
MRKRRIEALNGTLLFGLTTAFTFAMIRQVRDIERQGWGVQGKRHRT